MLGPQKFWIQKNLVPKKFGSEKYLGPKKFWVLKNFGSKKIRVQQKNLGQKRIWGQKFFLSANKLWLKDPRDQTLVKKIIRFKNVFGPNKFRAKKILGTTPP